MMQEVREWYDLAMMDLGVAKHLEISGRKTCKNGDKLCG